MATKRVSRASSCSPIGSPPQQNREFEIQKEKRPSTFHEGKQFPPARKPLYNPNATFGFLRSKSSLEKINNIPNYTTTIDLGKHSTNVKPSLESHYTSRRYSSCDANPPRYLFQWSTEINGFGRDLPKEPCSGKLKHAKHFWLGQRLNAYRAKIKSLIFSKSACSNKPSAIAANNVGEVKKPKSNKDYQDKYVQDGKTKPFEIFSDDNQKPRRSCVVTNNSSTFENGVISRGRRSFSGVIQRHFASKASSLSASSSRASSSLSTSFSLSSVGYNDPVQLFKRSSISQNSELERSIEEAIAHCKQSQQQSSSNKAPT